MGFTPLLTKNKVEYLELLNQINVSEDSSVNRARSLVQNINNALLAAIAFSSLD
jgi:hypothetical protein